MAERKIIHLNITESQMSKIKEVLANHEWSKELKDEDYHLLHKYLTELEDYNIESSEFLRFLKEKGLFEEYCKLINSELRKD